jgi:hypothetical protein
MRDEGDYIDIEISYDLCNLLQNVTDHSGATDCDDHTDWINVDALHKIL